MHFCVHYVLRCADSTCSFVGMESAKLRLWAKLIQTGRHDDYVTLSNEPLISAKITPPTHPPEPKTDELVDAVTEAATAIVNAINHPGVPQPQTPPKSANDQHVRKMSPLKVVALRRSCLDDLKQAKDLYEEDVLTDVEFQDEKHTF